MEHMDQALNNILNLAPALSDVFFKTFVKKNPFPSLKKSHMKTLMILRMEGSTAMTKVSHKIALEKGSFTPVANYLIQLGYIEKFQSPEDKRISMLSLTPEGYDFTSEIMKSHLAHVEHQLNKLSEDEKKVFISTVELLLSLTDKMRD